MQEIMKAIQLTLSVVSLVLLLLAWRTPLGNLRIFCLTTGEFAMATALAFGFSATPEMPNRELWLSVVWFFSGSIMFNIASKATK